MKAKAISFIRAHKRVIIFFLVAWIAFLFLWLIPNWSEGPFYIIFSSVMFVILAASQLFWIGRVSKLGKRLISRKTWRIGISRGWFADLRFSTGLQPVLRDQQGF